MSLKDRAISGLFWTVFGTFSSQIIAFIFGIILARLITPRDYGLLGMVTIFMAVSYTFINSGFSQSLIRKQNCSDLDYSTIFYFNLFSGLVLYFLLFSVAPLISNFFSEPELTLIIRVLTLEIIFHSGIVIQTTILTKKLDFKLITKVEFASSLISGLLGVILAFLGFGVWSLVYRALLNGLLASVLFWFYNNWRPKWIFSFSVIRELFSFGSKLLLSGIIDKIYFNIFNLVIGKFFSARDLGLYTRADMFKNLSSQNINEIVGRIAFPVLAQFQNDKVQLKAYYKRILTTTMFVTFIILLPMAAFAESMVISLIGENWRGSIIYLQLLCFVGVFYPMDALTRNLLYALGRSDIALKLEIMVKLLIIPTLVIGVFYGIKFMIISMIVASFVIFIVKSHFSGKYINYPIKNQFRDYLPSILVSIFVGGCVFVINEFIHFSAVWNFLLQALSVIGITVIVAEILSLDPYMFIKRIVIEKIKEHRG